MSDLQELLDRLVAAGAPGAAGWVRNEQGSLGAASGLANRRTGQPMRPELRFRAGSLTKSLVAAVVLRLAAEGRLSLEDPLERWLPGSLPYGDRVRLRQLLNYTGGVPHRTATLEQALYASRQGRPRAWTPQALVAMVADQPPAFPAGTTWSYSNTGYVLLGLVVEAASQSTLPDLTRFFRTLLGGRCCRPRCWPRWRPWWRSPLVPSPCPCTTAMAWTPGGRDARRPPARQRRRHPRLPEHRPQHPGRPPPARPHDQRPPGPGPRLRGVPPGVPGARQPAAELSARSRVAGYDGARECRSGAATGVVVPVAAPGGGVVSSWGGAPGR